VGRDGTVYVTWIDGCEGAGRRHVVHNTQGATHSVGDTSALYLARSVDQGRAFGENIRIAANICPCCRPAIAFIDDKIVIGWRRVEPGDIRDIYIAFSSDKGKTWEASSLRNRHVSWRCAGACSARMRRRAVRPHSAGLFPDATHENSHSAGEGHIARSTISTNVTSRHAAHGAVV
jgi:hypothetical protein